jgi:hypothetical protein
MSNQIKTREQMKAEAKARRKKPQLPLPEGTYKVKVIATKEINDEHDLPVQIEYSFADEKGQPISQKAYNWLNTEKARDNASQTVADILEEEADYFDHGKLVGKEVALTIRYQEGYSRPNCIIAHVNTIKTVSVASAPVEEFDIELE